MAVIGSVVAVGQAAATWVSGYWQAEAQKEKADFDILGPMRDQTPAQQVQAALAGLPIVADDGELVSRRRIPSRREVRGRPMRRDRED